MEVVRFHANRFEQLAQRFDEALAQVETGAVGGANVQLKDGTVFGILHELSRLDVRFGAGRCYQLGPTTIDYRIKRGRHNLDGLVEETFHAFRNMCGRAESLISDVRYRVDAAGLSRDKKVASLGAPVRFIAVTPLKETRVARTKSNIRQEPSPRAKLVGKLATGQSIAVTGRTTVAGKEWLRVTLAAGKSGFVLGSLLQEHRPAGQRKVAVTTLAPPKRAMSEQRILLRKDLGVRSAKELDGASACLLGDLESDSRLAAYFKSNNMKFARLTFDSRSNAMIAFSAWRCDIVSGPVDWLAREMQKIARPSDYILLPENIR